MHAMALIVGGWMLGQLAGELPPQSTTATPPPSASSIAAAPADASPAEKLLRELLAPPTDHPLTGKTLTLGDAVAQSNVRGEQGQIVRAYWSLVLATANDSAAQQYRAELDALAPQLRGATSWRVTDAAATAWLHESHANALAAQDALATAMHWPAEQTAPLPTTLPHLTVYRTLYREMAAQRALPIEAEAGSQAVPWRGEALDHRAAAVAATDEALMGEIDARRGDAETILRRLHDCLAARQEFLASVGEYNDSIVDYVLSVVGPEVTPAQLTGMLIKQREQALAAQTPTIRPLAAADQGAMTPSTLPEPMIARPLAAEPTVAPPRPSRDEVAPASFNAPADAAPLYNNTPANSAPTSHAPTDNTRHPTTPSPAPGAPEAAPLQNGTRPMLPITMPPESRQQIFARRPNEAASEPNASAEHATAGDAERAAAADERPSRYPPSEYPMSPPANLGLESPIGLPPGDDQTSPMLPSTRRTESPAAPLLPESRFGRESPAASGARAPLPPASDLQRDAAGGRSPGLLPHESTAVDDAASQAQIASVAMYPGLTGSAPHERLKQLAVALYWNRTLPDDAGTPVALNDCLRLGDPAARAAALDAYWRAGQRLAELQAQADRLQWLEELEPRVADPRLAPRLRAAVEAARAAKLSSQAALVEAQAELAARLGRASMGAPLLPNALPNIGDYAAGQAAAPAVSEFSGFAPDAGVHILLPMIASLGEALPPGADAVVEADALRARASVAMEQRPEALDEALRAIALQTETTMALARTLAQYNRLIGRHAAMTRPMAGEAELSALLAPAH